MALKEALTGLQERLKEACGGAQVLEFDGTFAAEDMQRLSLRPPSILVSFASISSSGKLAAGFTPKQAGPDAKRPGGVHAVHHAVSLALAVVTSDAPNLPRAQGAAALVEKVTPAVIDWGATNLVWRNLYSASVYAQGFMGMALSAQRIVEASLQESPPQEVPAASAIVNREEVGI